jgi:hypothetical protein
MVLLVMLFSTLLLIIVLPSKIDIPYNAFALCRYFSKQEIRDPNLDWVDMKTKQSATSKEVKPYFTDILSVDYYSDGKTLNAILWTFLPFQDRPLKYNRVDYVN